ncbi:MAG: hypothetical protein WDA16_05000 [Candidatus Thermoplasmatota archaeon]
MRVGPAIVLSALLLAGCLGGERTFPDESDQVQKLRVNAYALPGAPSPRPAIIEITGLGSDGQERAFRGHLSIVLDARPDGSQADAARVRTWELDVFPTQFASTTVAMYKITVDPGNIPADGNYSASATASIQGNVFNASASFAYTRA